MKPYDAVEITIRVGNRSNKDGKVVWEDFVVATELLTYKVTPRSATHIWIEIDAAICRAWRRIADARMESK